MSTYFCTYIYKYLYFSYNTEIHIHTRIYVYIYIYTHMCIKALASRGEASAPATAQQGPATTRRPAVPGSCKVLSKGSMQLYNWDDIGLSRSYRYTYIHT